MADLLDVDDHSTDLANLVRDVVSKHNAAVESESISTWSPTLWREFEDLGLPHIGIAEATGGSGGTWRDSFAVMTAIGKAGAALPYAETGFLGAWLSAEAGLPVQSGPAAIVMGTDLTGVLAPDENVLTLTGTELRVPWVSVSTNVVGLCRLPTGIAVFTVPTADVTITPGTNLAGEPRDKAYFNGVKTTSFVTRPSDDLTDLLTERAALARAAFMVGAAEHALELTITQARERVQFGRSIGSFQAIQHHLAIMAEECALAAISVDVAVSSLGESRENFRFAVAAAKIVAGETATTIAARAHQVHGAIGLTAEFELQRMTRRLWAWRDESGTELDWSLVAGDMVASAGSHGLWPLLTRFGGDISAS